MNLKNCCKFMFSDKKSGLAPIAIILIIAGVLIAGGGIWYGSTRLTTSWQKSKAPTQQACTQEAKLCPDGTAIGRTGPNCEFAACPEIKKDEIASSTTSGVKGLSPELAEGWKTHQNKEYGFSVNYPPTLKIIENPQTPESYLYSVSFENPLADKTTTGQKIVFNVSVFKDNNQLQNAFKSLTLDDVGKIMVDGYEAQKLFSPKGRAMSFTEATIYTIAAKNISLIFYGADFSEISETDMAKILSSFKFTLQ